MEVRYDKSTQPTFVRSIQPEGPSLFADNQTEFAIQGLYKF
jgi:hypothetical protein